MQNSATDLTGNSFSYIFYYETLLKIKKIIIFVKAPLQDFPGGAAVKNPCANTGDTGSSPVPGRSHMPWSKPQLLSPRATTIEARMPRARAPQQEKPPQ